RIAAHITLGAFDLRLIARDVALDLPHLRLDRTRVERDQKIALGDLGAVGEMNADDLVVEPALDRDACDRGDVADALEVHGRPLAHRPGHLDRYGARTLRCLRGRTVALSGPHQGGGGAKRARPPLDGEPRKGHHGNRSEYS